MKKKIEKVHKHTQQPEKHQNKKTKQTPKFRKRSG